MLSPEDQDQYTCDTEPDNERHKAKALRTHALPLNWPGRYMVTMTRRVGTTRAMLALIAWKRERDMGGS